MDVQLGRHAEPQPSDNELYLLKMPSFLAVEPRAFHHKTFQPPATNHHSTGPPSSSFSPFGTALSTLRWRQSPKDPSQLQSNARILRWSDGSLTLQLASNPLEQYELPAKGLAPPQHNPIKPTPTSIGNNRTSKDAERYNPQQDSYTYLVSPHEFSAVLRATHHITTSLTILPSSTVNDEALERLQESLSKAVRGNKPGAEGGINVIEITEDPELAKKKAEVAEREKIRAQRRRDQQEARERDRVNRTLGRSGLRTGGMGGLTVGGLEDDEGFTTTKGARARPRPSRAGHSDEEDGGYLRGRTREDEYDEDDGFLVGSDEEEEVPEESEEDIDDGIVERRESPKRGREPEPEDEDEGGEEGGVVSRGKRRRVIEDDEEE
ncbi:hypothetical protein L228DRAFT_12883 [Xylona heveae TC161]|uniref:Leo1-domain-containing protein n=1 Tax=Xylona heveae (strain CBS 132557 / TC161) TaxID=1328760 RepID=A0A165JNF1_XYLHT|nr:hypothetical protein L228DRAFT_12883 [Xylona heveae TC161]KZF26451.1 hypothetical protein L228DRAFT_12883 [Xylona heveae TC161]